jgi:hypothetical protein
MNRRFRACFDQLSKSHKELLRRAASAQDKSVRPSLSLVLCEGLPT